MHPYPHVYRVSAKAVPSGNVTVESPGLPQLQTAPPAEPPAAVALARRE